MQCTKENLKNASKRCILFLILHFDDLVAITESEQLIAYSLDRSIKVNPLFANLKKYPIDDAVISVYLDDQGISTSSGKVENTRVLKKFQAWLIMRNMDQHMVTADSVLEFVHSQTQWGSISRQVTATSIIARFIGWLWGYDHPAAKAHIVRPGTRPTGKHTEKKVKSEVVNLELDSQVSLDNIEEFLARKSIADTSKSTYRPYLVSFSQFLHSSNKMIADLTEQDILNFFSSRGWEASAQYVASVAVRSYIRYMVDKNLPATNVTLKKPHYTPQRTLKREQVETVIKYLEGNTPIKIRNRAIFWLLLDCGFRESEVAGILLEDLDIQNLTVGTFIKGEKFGWGKFSPQTAKNLSDWLNVRQMYADKNVKTLFVSLGGDNQGQAITREAVKDVVHNVCINVGLSVSPHVLRRAFAVILLESNVQRDEIVRSGRWENEAEVVRYTQAANHEVFRRFMPGAEIQIEEENPLPKPRQ